MSYEYSSESRRFDFPNPFRVENLFRFAAGAVLLIGGFALLLISRGNLAANVSLWSAAPILTGVYLILHGIAYIGKSMSQLRFFFGRGEPLGLAPELRADGAGDSKAADAIKETMRQNTLTFKEPTGALNGLLYSIIPRLIYAPGRVQEIAQRQFQTGLAMAATLLSLVVAWAGFSEGVNAAWMGLFYFAFSAFLILKPLEYGAAARANLDVRGLLVLILMAVFGPVLIPLVGKGLPDISWLSLTGQAFCLLLAAMSAVSLFFVALTKQLIEPPPTTMGCETMTISVNAHPKQILDELDRELQRNWVEKIPNRRYTKVSPEISGNSGAFTGEALEETQPMPIDDLRRIDLGACFSEPRYRWLGWLNLLGLALVFVSTAAFVVFGISLKPTSVDHQVFTYASVGIVMLLVGHFCFGAGHLLWGRFDFRSEVVWVEMHGNYQSAKFDYGNQFADRIKTQKQVINIETMTLRVWAAQIDTVAFGKGVHRYLVGMNGLPDKARYLAAHLIQFASNQSVIVAPSAATLCMSACAVDCGADSAGRHAKSGSARRHQPARGRRVNFRHCARCFRRARQACTWPGPGRPEQRFNRLFVVRIPLGTGIPFLYRLRRTVRRRNLSQHKGG
jgi:hypothetical protein